MDYKTFHTTKQSACAETSLKEMLFSVTETGPSVQRVASYFVLPNILGIQASLTQHVLQRNITQTSF